MARKAITRFWSWQLQLASTGPPIGGGPYTLQVDLHRPFLESQPIGTRQILPGFYGAILPRNIFDPRSKAMLACRRQTTTWLAGDWIQQPIKMPIDSILETVNKQFSEFLGTDGRNGHFSSSGVGGEFDIEIQQP
ncbi:MAG: hypothetical protein R3C99_06740 [Pirellulaceae bacterium]